MQEILFPFLGGIGLFLIGMMLLSDGLTAFASGTFKRNLGQYTGTPCRAFVSGTLVTALAQSSTATTVTLIGFVSAGLIPFSQAIGVLIGASLGNTVTGWIVAGLGLKINLGFYTLPLIGLGALLKLLTRGRWAVLGMALVGFGLMFLGLNTLREGMQALSAMVSLADLPAGGFKERFMIMLFGLAMTIILQSSSTAIATTLTALHAHTLNLDQAAALVVGAAIGTTFTGVLVTIGGTIYAKRTALAYILFNAITGLFAILLLPIYFSLVYYIGQYFSLQPGAISLAAFHSLFIAVGVVLFLPFTQQFAQIVERILPSRGENITERLDDSMLAIPAVALEASQRALEQVADRLLDAYDQLLQRSLSSSWEQQLTESGIVLDEIFIFVSRVHFPAGEGRWDSRRIAQLHAIDHLLRLRSRIHDLFQAEINFSEPVYGWALENSRCMLELARKGIAEKDLTAHMERIEHIASTLTNLSHQVRNDFLQTTAPGNSHAAAVLRTTDIFRWLNRTGNHIWRTCHYLSLGRNSGHFPAKVVENFQPDPDT